jgi:hypothetical protein
MATEKTNITYRVQRATERKIVALANAGFSKPGLTLDRLIADAWDAAVLAGLVRSDMLDDVVAGEEPQASQPQYTQIEAGA